MDLDEIKRGLRAEIKKRENEQYFTFQCNVRQMCKDVLAKLEEQESVIAENDKEIAELKKQVHDYAQGLYVMQARAEKEARHQKYKRCLGKAQEWRNYATVCGMQSHCHNHRGFCKTAEKWTWKECHAWRCRNRWLKISEQFKEAK